MIFIENGSTHHGRRKRKRVHPTRRRGKSGKRSTTQGVSMAARRSRRRKHAARRKSRRSAVAVVHHNAPKRRRRRGVARAKSRRTARRGVRRNPPGIIGGLMEALGNGVSVSAGQIAQNGFVRYVPDVLPATMPQAALLNGLVKDAAGVIAGAMFASRVLGAKRAEFVVAGQASAAINRVIRAVNVPVVSTMLGEYDPIRLGTYTPGVVVRRAPVAALPAGGRNNVSTLKGVGIYTDGMSAAPGLF